MESRQKIKIVTDIILIIAGAAIAAFAVEEFLVPNTILDGGVVGISIMVNALTNIPLGILTFLINLPFLIFGSFKLGKSFIVHSAVGMASFSVFVGIFEKWIEVTQVDLLAVVFGGVILGIGVGLVIRSGGCLDGTETIAIILNRKFKWQVGQTVLIFNVIIYTVAGLLFGWDRAMFSLLTYFIASKVIDIVETGFDKAKAAMIITDESEEISRLIYERLGRTVTILEGEGLISGKKVILYCVLNKFEINDLRSIINSIDASAFIAISDVEEIIGTHIKKKGVNPAGQKDSEQDK
ncbi:MAG: YitT family protein [Lachnospiraceae bacterium]|nr:YitT family protein [Lachnospiraceae bacterium]